MGEAKEKRKRQKHLLEKEPWCIYCGGTSRAETIDHLPPISFFRNRHRPKGLEFPACKSCNNGSALFEQAASLISRISPDPTTEKENREFLKILQEVDNNHPGLLLELNQIENEQEKINSLRQHFPDAAGALNVRGPILNTAIERFGVKLGLALHYFRTGKIIPNGGGVSPRWYSNESLIPGGLPDDLIRMMGPPETLKQGKFEVPDQFLFASTYSENGEMSAHWVTFRRSFAIAIFSATNLKLLESAPPSKVFSPGIFKGNNL